MLRGEDAAGVCGVREEKNEKNQKVPAISVYKRALHVVDFMNTKGFGRMLDRFSDYYYVLGHVRASTVGGAYDHNAHPFTYDDITLVHNGTVTNAKHGLRVKADEDVDSAHVALAVAEYGEKDTLEKLEGGYSLVWHNAADDSINFARNERKPMAIAFVKGRNEMYYASEWRMLWCLLGRNDIEIDGNIQITKPFYHYKFHKEDLRKWTVAPYKVPNANPQKGETFGRRPIVHPPNPKSTDTPTPANARTAKTSTENGQSTPSGQGTTSKNSAPSSLVGETRKWNLNERIRDYGWEHGTRLIMTPAAFVPNTDAGCGRLIVEHPTQQYPELLFVMYRVSPIRADHYEEVGKVACYIDNFVEQDDGVLRLILREEPDLQKVIEGEREVFAKLAAHGFLDDEKSKEAPKSDNYDPAPKKTVPISKGEDGIATVTIDARTGEVLEEEEETDAPVFKGPFGTQISTAEFRELCRAGCGRCDGDIDIRDFDRISWHGSALICEYCTNDPIAQAELAYTKPKH